MKTRTKKITFNDVLYYYFSFFIFIYYILYYNNDLYIYIHLKRIFYIYRKN